MDLTAAFDTVDHEILKKKLEYYGMTGKIVEILKSYLDNRFKYVELEQARSKVKKVFPALLYKVKK